MLPYIYLTVFAVLISPIQSWLGALSGMLFGKWDRLWSDFSTGALFAYAALLGFETLLRLELLPSITQTARPRTISCLKLSAIVASLFGVLCLSVMWFANGTVPIAEAAHWFGATLCASALCLAFYTIRLEKIVNRPIETITGARAVSRSKKAGPSGALAQP